MKATEVSPWELIDQGYSIFPCDAGDKRPVARDASLHPASARPGEIIPRLSWGSEATDDPTKIQEWINSYPGCSWGIPTGSINGLVVVDIDSDEAGAWWDSQWLPDGRRIQSASGNWHIYYAVGQKYDIQTNRSKIFKGADGKGIDIRGEGGYVVAYEQDLRSIPAIPDSVLAILPAKQEFSAGKIPDDIEPPSEISEAEKRVLQGITDTLDSLPRKWHKGAGYHDVQFRAACFLGRIINSPYYATDAEYARSLFNQHAPLREGEGTALRDQRWDSAMEATRGQFAEPPGDVPIRLNALETLDKYRSSQIDELFWNSTKVGQVKSLIHEMRLAGATEQEAYSVSYESAAMSAIRKSNQGSSSTWGYVLNEYSMPLTDDDGEAPEPIKAVAKAGEGARTPITLLSAEERAIVRDYPNFIDSYIDVARAIYEEPNMPIHYVNSWSALSASMGDRARLYFETGETPLNLWTMKMAPSAAGKSDANKYHDDVVDACSARGFRDIDLGSDASAEALADILMDRNRKSSMMFMDEAHKFLNESKATGSYQYKVRQAFLELYDGRVSQPIRKGMDKASVGDRVWSNFILSLQGTWAKMTEAMEEGDIESGFVGRFLVAVGDGPKITRKSLTLKFAPEYQVETNSGRHPLVDAFCAPVRQAADGIAPGALVAPASDAVIERLADMRLEMDAYAKKHPLGDHLLGVFLRIGVNIFKGAALLAISEGRTKVEMTDLLLAAKSGEHWIKSSVALAEAISTSEYRRLVEYVVEQVCIRPRSRANLLSMARLKNLRMFEASEVIDRAEREGKIRFDTNKQKFYEKED